jgi:predicted nucleic acid-binding protein
MSLILDSSATAAWVYMDETGDAIRHVFDLVIDKGAWVPSLWRLEIANILEMGVRRGRHNATFRDATLADLALLPITIDPERDRQAWSATLRLAERYHLTLYAAAYLELAQRRDLPLATLDTELRAAGRTENVALLSVCKRHDGCRAAEPSGVPARERYSTQHGSVLIFARSSVCSIR